MTDREFDQILYQGANELPPEQESGGPPTPWRKALTLVCWGIILTSISLNFLLLQYILPAVGSVLLCLGIRSLRRGNRWLGLAFGLSVLLLVIRSAHIILLATPLTEWLNGGGSLIWGLAVSPVVWFLYFALWRGLKQVLRKAGQPPQARAAGSLVICYALFIFLALLDTSGLPALILTVVWVIIIWEVFKLSRCLDQAGYAIEPAPVRFSNRLAILAVLLGLLAAVVLCLFLFSRYPVDAAPTQMEHGQAELRTELAELGFPEEVLADLTDDEVAGLKGAWNIDVSANQPSQDGEDLDRLSTYFVQVQLPDDCVRYFLWFSWEQAPSHWFRDGIQVTPSVHDSVINLKSPVQGRLLWEEDGQLFQSPLEGAYAIPSQTWAESHVPVNVNFSLPSQGSHIRGYVSYTARLVSPTISQWYNADVYYIHQEFWFSYPWISPCRYRQEVNSINSFFFPSRQYAAQFLLEKRPDSEP